MTPDTQLERAFAPPREDARDLIARLCHELGVSAVARALGAQEPAASHEAEAESEDAGQLPIERAA
jgi:hypothetical protein